MINKSIKRIPRPLGSTSLAIQANLSNDSRDRQAFNNFIINQWILGNEYISQIRYDIFTLAQALKIPVQDIRIMMRDRVINSAIWDKDKQESILYGLMGEMVSWTLEDRMKINAQVELLTRSQGNTYKPFISSELNKALKLSLDSSASIQSMIQKLTGGGGTTNIFNIDQSHDDHSVNNYVTQEQVLEIINAKPVESTKEAKLLETRYDLNALPEVVATKQEGIDISKEGLGGKINVSQLNSITDDMKAAMSLADLDHHAMRREIESGIDLDGEDPELDIYEEVIEEPKQDFSSEDFLNT